MAQWAIQREKTRRIEKRHQLAMFAGKGGGVLGQVQNQLAIVAIARIVVFMVGRYYAAGKRIHTPTQALDLIAETFMSFEIWLTVAGVYLVMTITLSVFMSLLELRVKQRS